MINVSDEARDKIKNVLADKPGVLTRIVLKKSGCAGMMLILTVGSQEPEDSIVEASGISFAISQDALPFSNGISIYIQNGLGGEVVVRNNLASKKCKCGKSFATSEDS